MVRITNGVDVFEVTSGAFEKIFSLQGYVKVDDDVEETEVEAVEEVEVEAVEDEFAELLEKPISHWNKAEVKKFAGAKGIDIAGTKSIVEAKEIIKQYL